VQNYIIFFVDENILQYLSSTQSKHILVRNKLPQFSNAFIINFVIASGWNMKHKDQHNQSALKVNKGVEQPSAINPNLKNLSGRFKKDILTTEQYFDGILKRDRTIVSKAITLIESALPEHKKTAKELISLCLPYSERSFRLGITGVPGAGKSTFIEAFGLYAVEQGKKVAVLAIDPASNRSKGSILGDKTRMEKLSAREEVFIRPSSNAGTLGGVSRNTRESMIILEAAGYDLIIIETVGVGQSETAVAQMTDLFLLMMIAGAGDELQGIKRGIMEMADIVLINKADGDNVKKAEMAKREIENALHLFPARESAWIPKVLTASALEQKGIDKTWKLINEYQELTKKNGFFEEHRKQQLLDIMNDNIKQSLIDSFYNNKKISKVLETSKNLILEGKTTPYEEAEKLLRLYFGK
jgi:LAO/AO transport system kinase